MALKALGNDALNLLCTCLTFTSSLQLLAGSQLGAVVACSYAASPADTQQASPPWLRLPCVMLTAVLLEYA